MAVTIPQEIKEIINDKDAVKVIASISREGIPHVTFKGSLKVNDDGLIEYLEFIESSQTNKNLVNAIWFSKTVAINILLGKKSIQIKGRVRQAIIAGKDFEERYNAVQETLGTDLSTVYLIEADEILDESFEKRLAEETERHPIFRHLD